MAQPTWIGYKLNDRYLIEQELGSGGMSAVYKAQDPNLKRIVAIKLIHSHLSRNPDFVRRFETEASSVAQLRHPNIVQVYDFNHDGDTYYMVLEFVPGESLQERLKRLNDVGRKLSANEVIDLASKTCDAVHYAHKRGLVHRDIKPANVMLNVQGEPILMDFGIVRILGGTSHTATGAVVGTALYMSPEQIRGEHPDHRADIYSLGVMLYEMVSGKPPYESDSAMTIMMMHLNDPVPDIQNILPDTPPGLKPVIERALAKNPNDRYQSAGEMAAAIRASRFSGVAAGAPAGTVVGAPAPQATFVEPARSAPPPQATYVESGAPPPTSPGTIVETPAPVSRPQPVAPAMAAPAKKRGSSMLLLGGGGVAILLLICIIAGVIFLPGLFDGDDPGVSGEATQTEAVAVLVGVTDTPTHTDLPPSPTLTNTPTITPSPTITPTPTPTEPVGPYVLITEIVLENGVYFVTYEVFNFTPLISTNTESMHIHFFWNTYDPITVGVNGIGDSTGGGSWSLYDVPSPFNRLSVSNRPTGATQICALVANYDHSINLDTGNCVDLPE
ncbi:MAG TPA: protein kinase [Anaerolineales bacterium]|nr:protein kinase [Anaerolineales bacterium]